MTSRFGSLTINAYDQTDAANKAIRWALGFYDEEDLQVVSQRISRFANPLLAHHSR